MRQQKICGIYIIINVINYKVYVGQSVDIIDRWRDHKWELRNNKHKNSYLQNAWNKYGEENFKFEIVEECILEKLNDREIYWISHYKKSNLSYNLTDGGEGTHGWIPSDETKRKISEANKGKIMTKENKENILKANHTNKNPILQIDIDGNIIKRWDCEMQIRKELNIDTRSIRGCLNKEPKRYTYKNNIWIYEEDYNKNGLDLDYYLKKKQSKRIKQLTLEGVLIKIWDKISDASNELLIKDSFISQVAKGKAKTAGGFKWEYC